MAPNKRKKKAAGNPARGFATTSIASKPRVNEQDDPEIQRRPEIDLEAVSVKNETRTNGGKLAQVTERDLQDLSPEELETQLENSNLQILLDSYGERSKKEVSRQFVRLETERRLLRSQAQHLSTRHWLPDEIMQLITDLLNKQMKEDSSSKTDAVTQKSFSCVSEDDLLFKLWSLMRLLPHLGFSSDVTELALQNLLLSRTTGVTTTKDTMWGLDQSLEWIAAISSPEDLPTFEPQEVPRQYLCGEVSRSRGLMPSVLMNAEAQPNSCVTTGSSTPISTTNPGMQLSMEETSSLSSQSDSDSDHDLDQQVTKYVDLHSQLYAINPELPALQPRSTGKKKKNADRPPAANLFQGVEMDRRVLRLTAKLNKIRSDVLFDEDLANERWADMYFDLVKETIERKRFDIDDFHKSVNLKLPPRQENGVRAEQDDQDTDETLGELLTGLPDIESGPATGASRLSITGSGAPGIQVKDFGKWTGMSPRRVFEEACKARDSHSRVSYKQVSSSSFSKRHLLEIRWSRDQDPITVVPPDAFAYEYDRRHLKLCMTSVACPDTIQSESYISTIALFVIFASVPKEEKAHLRLPPVWRDLWDELLDARKEQADLEDREALRELRKVMEGKRKDPNKIETPSKDRGIEDSRQKNVNKSATMKVESADQDMPNERRRVWTTKTSSAAFQKMLTPRTKLPIWKFKNDILHAIDTNQIIIICGETGCGKSTQIPSFIVEHSLSNGLPCKVYCTEPRRISAISLARRVSEELGERRGDVGTIRSLVGYAIRLESQVTPQTRLVYATTGIVMRMLEHSDDLTDITHLVLDEVHERSIDSDFLLIVIRKLLVKRTDLKVILMSATVDAQRFSDYLDHAPVFNVPGRTFPVETRFLEDAVEITQFNVKTTSAGYVDDDDDIARDASTKSSLCLDNLVKYSSETRNTLSQLDEYRINYGLVLKLLETIAAHGEYASYSNAILVFLPGIAEIKRLNDMILAVPTFSSGWYVYPLHSTIATEEQERAFIVTPGMRKIVLATNIAETGITIPDITCVIDIGKHKEMRYDERRQLSRLIEAFISRSNAKQRRGRAGRVQKGLCFHLFTKERHDNTLPEEQTPEMLRLSLQDLVLRVKICKLGGIEQTLSEALDPPSLRNVRRAIDSLIDVKALTNNEELTPLGRQLARLPLDVFLGKLVLLGTIFGCLDAMLTIAAILSSKSPFSSPMGMRSQADVARLAFRKGDSDLLTVHNAYSAWRRMCKSSGTSEYEFCRKNFLSQQTLSNIEDLKAQLTTALFDAGFIIMNDSERASLNRVRSYSRKRNFVEIPGQYNNNDDNDLMLNSVVAWSFYPKLLKRERNGWRNIANNQSVSLHPTSVNKGINQPPQWLSFYHIMQSSNKFYNAHETSPVEQFALALVCGEAEFRLYSGVMVIDGNRARFSFDNWKTMLAFKALRSQIRTIMAQKFRNPNCYISVTQAAWLDVWQRVFTLAGKTVKTYQVCE